MSAEILLQARLGAFEVECWVLKTRVLSKGWASLAEFGKETERLYVEGMGQHHRALAVAQMYPSNLAMNKD